MTLAFLHQDTADLFRADPGGCTAPQYDGYCAWAMTESRLGDHGPEVWKIVEGSCI